MVTVASQPPRVRRSRAAPQEGRDQRQQDQDPREMMRISFNARFAPNDEQPGYGRYVARPLAPRPRLGFTAKARGPPAAAAVAVVAR